MLEQWTYLHIPTTNYCMLFIHTEAITEKVSFVYFENIGAFFSPELKIFSVTSLSSRVYVKGVPPQKNGTHINNYVNIFESLGAILVYSTDYFSCFQRKSCVNLLFAY